MGRASLIGFSGAPPSQTEPQMKVPFKVLGRLQSISDVYSVTGFSLFILLAAVRIHAQQTSGTPGSPSATTTINGLQIPNPPKPFIGP
jgi:hypothetical protein